MIDKLKKVNNFDLISKVLKTKTKPQTANEMNE